MAEKKTMGRPSKYDPDWVEKLYACPEEGYSVQAIAAELKVPLTRLYGYMEEHEDFRYAVEYARNLDLLGWIKLGRENMLEKNFNFPLYSFMIKNMHGWSRSIEDTPKQDKPDNNVTIKVIK